MDNIFGEFPDKGRGTTGDANVSEAGDHVRRVLEGLGGQVVIGQGEDKIVIVGLAGKSGLLQ